LVKVLSKHEVRKAKIAVTNIIQNLFGSKDGDETREKRLNCLTKREEMNFILNLCCV